ncbi:hypothetical protein [Desulfonema ishimotonii]|nr:hypothetical protein [Desulfonema ishimotonii]
MTKKIICSIVFCLLFCNTSAIAQTLSLNKYTFTPGEKINVRFTARSDFAGNAWVGIIPSGVQHGSESVNDQHDLTYQYLKKRTSGTLTFTAPSAPGSYDFRMHDTDDSGREIASVSFTVQKAETAATALLQLDRYVFTPGEKINVRFTARSDFAGNAWVGIIPSGVQHGSESVNDQHDLTYQYLKKRTSGTLTFTAPSAPGSYDFRMHDTDDSGREIASVSFTVQKAETAATALLQLDRYVFTPGEKINVRFTARSDFAGNAWVGIIPSGIQHGSESVNDQHDLTYQYLKKRTSGTLTFTAPSAPGSYDFRMHDTDDSGREISSVSFTVKKAETAATALLQLDRYVFSPGEKINVRFTARSDFAGNAWVGIIPSGVQHGSESVNDQHDLTYQYLKKRTSGTLTFTAPSAPGAYDFRMHDTDDNGREISSVSFNVR